MSAQRITRSSSSAQAAATSSTLPSHPPARATKRANPSSEKPNANKAEATNGRNPPATPPPKRLRRANPPPETPTPAPISLLSGLPTPSRRPASSTAPQSLEARPADPRTTNAPLITPRGSRLTTYPSLTGTTVSTSTSTPSLASTSTSLPASTSISTSTTLPPPTTTTTTLLTEACTHLIATEPRLAPVIAAHPCAIFSPAGLAAPIDPFASLASGIIAQQVSGAAAASIKRKFVSLFAPPGPTPAPADATATTFSDAHADADAAAPPFPTAAQVAGCEVAFLRQAGLSGRKAEYIKGLAEKFVGGELSARMLLEAPYEEVLERLMAVRGLGRWSVEMFACFGLKRMDVFSVGDLGVQRGMAALLGKDVKKLKAKGGKWKYMSEADMLAYSEKFAPYRSLFMWYMWRIEDVNVDAVQDA